MNNPAHLLIHTDEINKVETLMGKINTAYAVFYNLQKEKSGYVFFNRYHSEIIENGIHLLSCIKYIHENPVKAEMVERGNFY